MCMLEPGNGEWSHSLYTVLSLNLRYYRGSSLHQRERERERPRSAHNLLIPALLMPPLLFSAAAAAAAASTLPQSSLYSLRACFERAHTPPRPPAKVDIHYRTLGLFFLLAVITPTPSCVSRYSYFLPPFSFV